MRAFPICIALLALTASAPAVADELDALAKVIEDKPDDKAGYDAYALAAFKAKRFDDAIKRLKVGVARIPDYGEGYYKLAYAYRQKKEWPDAADYYRRYIALNPSKTDPYFGLGASLQGMGDKKGAIAAYDKYVALEKAPDKQRFVAMVKDELIKLDPSRAPPPPVAPPVALPPPVTTLREPPPVTPVKPAGPPRADAAALRASAEQLRKDGKLEDAAGAYQKAIEADRGNVELYNDLGNVYFAMKRYADAAAAFRESTSRDPSYALGWYNLAHALRKGDKKSEAVVAYRQYMKLKPEDPDPYYGLAQTLKSLGDTPGAIEAFRKYIGMEKRPDEQRWVEKAKTELEVLESMQRSTPSGKIDEKGADDELVRAASERLRRELERDRLAPMEGDTDLMDPFEPRGRLRDPFGAPVKDLKDPFERDRAAPVNPLLPADRQRLQEYGAAIENFRRALSRHAEDVTQRYQRGTALAFADNPRAATRVLHSVPLDDPRVDSARKGVERIRQSLLASRK
jgi:tetratricopeptide (TPR) repeat protein